MEQMKYLFGPIPSRRLGRSLGVSPIPERTCNNACVYCQLGRTRHMTPHRRMFFPVEDILDEVRRYLTASPQFDVITIVGEGEPTLYAGLGQLIDGLQGLTDKPVAVITNGNLLSDPGVRAELMHADIVLPSFDAFDQESFHAINRPHPTIKYADYVEGMAEFARVYKGQLWLEVMLVSGMNDDDASLAKLASAASAIKHERTYINIPVRPPAESFVRPPSHERVMKAVELLHGISIDMLEAGNFFSEEPDPVTAIYGIVKRHPMTQFEVAGFLASRKVTDVASVFAALNSEHGFSAVDYKGIVTYRAK